MFYLSSILHLLLVTATAADTDLIKDDKNLLSTVRDPGTFDTPFTGGIVLKDPKDFDIPKDDYHINPSTKQELANMLAYADNVLPKPNEDVIAVTSERFEKIQADYAQKEATSTENVATTRMIKNVLRQNTRPPQLIERNARSRAFALMTQFIYGARYKLQYGQRLRSVYNTSLDYKIGVGFMTIKELKGQQLNMYSNMHLNLNRHIQYVYKKKDPKVYSVLALPEYLELYKNIVERHVDLMDVIAYLYVLNGEREKIEKTRTTLAEAEEGVEDSESE